jgi:predicted nucleotidyltransferase
MKTDTPSVLLAPEIEAERIFARSIDFCSRRTKREQEEVFEGLRAGDSELHSTLRYAIAKEVAAYLKRLGGRSFRGVYLYGSAMQGGAHLSSDIDLIVLVCQKRDQIAALLRRADLALVTVYRTLLATGAAPGSLLDVHIVDLGEKMKRQGYGAILDSVGICPVCLWRYPRDSGAPLAGSSHIFLSARE